KGALLIEANLSQAKLIRANLTGADMYAANLSGAHLIYANLSGADLRGANLSESLLHNANLSDTNLGSANLSGANLYQANLSGAKVSKNLKELLYNININVAELIELEKEVYHRSRQPFQVQLSGPSLSKTSTLRIRINEEPLTAYNLFIIISALTELHTKLWL